MAGVGAGDALSELHNVAKRLGVFEVARVGEFRGAPPNGVCFAVWAQELGSGVGGGLATTAPLLSATARIYAPGTRKPERDLEIDVLNAADLYLGGLNAGFTLGGVARNVDILGEQGDPLKWQFGHIVIDNKIFRIADLQVHVVLRSEWAQAE
jgi:hypothetical protein